MLPTGDQTATVAVFNPAGLAAARKAGVLFTRDLGGATAAGKAFEEKVLKELQGGQ